MVAETSLTDGEDEGGGGGGCRRRRKSASMVRMKMRYSVMPMKISRPRNVPLKMYTEVRSAVRSIA